MNLQEQYKRLFKGRIRSNDSKLINETLNLSSVKSQLLALSKKYPGYANALADYMDSGIWEDAWDIVRKADPTFDKGENSFDTEYDAFERIGFFGQSEDIVKVDSGEVNGMDRTASGTYGSKKWKLETNDGFTSIFVNGKSIDDDDPMYDDILTTVNDEGYELED